MTATLTQLRAGLATRLQTISGLQVNATVPGTVDVPAVVIGPAPGQFVTYGTSLGDSTGAETDDWAMVITLFVSAGDDPSGQAALDAYVAPSGALSIPAAVQGDPTLGGIVGDCDVVGARSYGVFEYNGNKYFGCEFPVQVLG